MRAFGSASASKRRARRSFSDTIAAPSPQPVERGSDDAERKDLREGRFRFDAQETAELPVGRLDDRKVPVAIDSRSRPATPQPVGVDDGHADERDALFVREGSDLVRVLVLRGPHPETGKQLHRASVPDPRQSSSVAERVKRVRQPIRGPSEPAIVIAKGITPQGTHRS